MDEVKTALNEEYLKTLQEVSKAKLDSEESRWALTKLNELSQQRINELKAESEVRAIGKLLVAKEKEQGIKEREQRLKELQLRAEKKDCVIKIVFDMLGLVVPIGFSSYWMARGLRFEETGTFTSRTGQWIRSNLNLFKK